MVPNPTTLVGVGQLWGLDPWLPLLQAFDEQLPAAARLDASYDTENGAASLLLVYAGTLAEGCALLPQAQQLAERLPRRAAFSVIISRGLGRWFIELHVVGRPSAGALEDAGTLRAARGGVQ